MWRAALACTALVACKGDTSTDRPAPSPPPAPAPVAADAAAPEVAGHCYPVPFDADAERAGIRRLAHHAGHATIVDGLPAANGVTLLAIGKPTLVKDLHPAKQGAPLGLRAELGAGALVTMAKITGDQVEVTAPAFLEGAVFSLDGDRAALVAVGAAGLATLSRYRMAYVKPRLAKAPRDGDHVIAGIDPEAVFDEDIDGDGTLELVAFSRLAYKQPAGGFQVADGFELGVLWQTGEFASASLCCTEAALPAFYLAPPTSSGGKPLLLSLVGDRFVVDGKSLVVLPPTPRAPTPVCLQTSSSEPAQLVARP